MENGVVAVGGAQLGERNGVGEDVVESREEEMPVVLSEELKTSEEDDEVYEEAISGDTPRIDREERAFRDDGNAEKIESSDTGDEAEKFEEAIGGTSDLSVYEGKEDGLVMDERISSEQDVENKPDQMENNWLEGDELEEPLLSVGMVKKLKEGNEISDKLVQDSKKLENGLDRLGIDEVVADNVVANVETANLRDQGHEPLGTQNANEVKGGNQLSNLEAESNGDLLQRGEENAKVNEADGAISAKDPDENLQELENIASSLYSDHLDSTVEGVEDFPTESDVKLKETESSSMAAENEDFNREQEAVQANVASSSDNHVITPGDEINLHPPLEERAEARSVGLITESSGGSEPSIHDSEVVGKETDNEDKVDKVQRAGISNFTSVSSGGSETNLMDANAATLEKLSMELERKDDNVVQVNQSGTKNMDPGARLSTDASLTTGVSAIPALSAGLAHPASGNREQESIPGNRQRQIKPTTDVSPSSTGSATSATLPTRPAGLGRAAPLLEPTSRLVQQPRVNGTVSPLQNQLVEDPSNGEAEENDETREKLQMIRVKFLRLAHRLGQTTHNVVVAQVLYRLGLAEQLRGRSGSRVAAFNFDRASSVAEQLEASGQEPLDFSCTIMVLGKTGVGKSATINSIFDEVKFGTDAFQSSTKKVQDVVGTVQGIKVRVIDTPGLLSSWSDQRKNEKILQSVKQYIKRTPPDIVLYLDRLDMPSREFGDMPLLRTITENFGPSIWFNAIVVLTHAASAPPEGPNGTTSYDMFVTQRSHVVQQAIRQAAGDMRLMNPVSLVENHSACRTNRAGQRVLPNGQVWKPHLLLLSFASKILAEANTLLKLQDSPPGKSFAPRTRAPPLPFLLSSLLQSRPPVKLPMEQFGGDDDALDDDLDESSDSEDESEYDELPPFKQLTKSQLATLSRAQRKAYYDELEYRERLFMKKQLKEEKKRRKMMKKMQAAANDLPAEYRENVEEESGGAASVPVPVPDLALPASFDSDNPTHRYRCLDSSNQWLVRPVLDPNSWDHDVGYEGINVERLFAVKEKIPISFSGQVSKDKKDTNLQMEIASTVKHGEGKATSIGFDLQSVGREIAYTLRNETRFSNWRKNKVLAGLSVTLLGDTLTGGLKVEDKLIVNKQGQLVVSAGAVVGRGDVAYGGSLEATLRDKDHPLGRFLSTFGLSVMDWHGDLAIGCNLQSQIPIGRNSNLIGRVSVNNRGSGQVSIRLNSSEHLQIVLIGIVPMVRKILSHFQPVQLG